MNRQVRGGGRRGGLNGEGGGRGNEGNNRVRVQVRQHEELSASLGAGFPQIVLPTHFPQMTTFGDQSDNNNIVPIAIASGGGQDEMMIVPTTGAPTTTFAGITTAAEFEIGESSNANANAGVGVAVAACTCVTCPLHAILPAGHQHQIHPPASHAHAHAGGGGNMWWSAQVQGGLQNERRGGIMQVTDTLYSSSSLLNGSRDNIMMMVRPARSSGRISSTTTTFSDVNYLEAFPPPLPLPLQRVSDRWYLAFPVVPRPGVQLSHAARAWIERLIRHQECLVRAFPPPHASGANLLPDPTQPFFTFQPDPPLPLQPLYDFPRFISDVNTLTLEIRTALRQLLNEGFAPIADLLIIDYSVVLSLLDFCAELMQEPQLPQAVINNEQLLLINMDEDEDMEDANESGLSQREIATFLPREIFSSNGQGAHNTDLCSICQEDYVHGEELGRLDCRHVYHYACIKQWLAIKNLCPICKRTALSSVFDDYEDNEDGGS